MQPNGTAGKPRYLSFCASHDLTDRLDTAAVVAGVSRSHLIRTAASQLAEQILEDGQVPTDETLPDLEAVAVAP